MITVKYSMKTHSMLSTSDQNWTKFGSWYKHGTSTVYKNDEFCWFHRLHFDWEQGPGPVCYGSMGCMEEKEWDEGREKRPKSPKLGATSSQPVTWLFAAWFYSNDTCGETSNSVVAPNAPTVQGKIWRGTFQGWKPSQNRGGNKR